jgi:hypothetical protein
MTLKILQEVTEWKVQYRQPNHVYLVLGDRAVAYSQWGESQPQYFQQPQRLDRRGRRFVEAAENSWGFDLSVGVTQEPQQPPRGQTWQVSGSKGQTYVVSRDRDQWSCTCPGYVFRRKCRHVTEQQQKEQLSLG